MSVHRPRLQHRSLLENAESIEGPYGAASGEADSSTLLALTERNRRDATTPLPARPSCAHASQGKRKEALPIRPDMMGDARTQQHALDFEKKEDL
uniref:Uncharacterized protein n=1 Tax=Knipowitschia caucasica TaxID=637954 RepID=A0AAV2LFN4_KNICA